MQNNLSESRGGTICLSKAGLAEGANDATIKQVAPNGAGIDYAIDGLQYHKADGDNIAITALAQQAALTTCLYGIQINAAGTYSMKKGDEVLTADLTAGTAVLEYPVPDANNCMVGYLKIATAAATTYTNGTTDMSAAGITATFYDCMLPPARPRTS